MKKILLFFVVMVVTTPFIGSPGWAQCPEDPLGHDLGVCDTIYVETWPYTDTCFSGDCATPGNKINNPGSHYPCFFYVSLFVTHDSNTFWSENFNNWVQDSIAAFIVPLKYWKTGQADSVILPTTSNWNNKNLTRGSALYKRSIFRDLVDDHTGDTVYNRFADMAEMGWDPWQTSLVFKAPDSAFFGTLNTSGFGRWWEGSKVLLATHTFIVYMADGETTQVCFDSTFWPPEENLSFVRYDAERYFPRSNIPVCFHVPPYVEPVDCDRSYADDCLTFCPLGDIDFEVTLRDSVNSPVAGYSNVWLDFTNCASGILPCSSFHPLWPKVFPEGPSDANGRVYFRVHAGGYSDHSVKVMAGCGKIAEVSFPKSVDLSGNLLLEPEDFDPIYGNHRDFNCDDTVDWRDDNIFKLHKNHGCYYDPCLFLNQTVALDPDTTLVPGDSIDVKWRLENLNSLDNCYIEKVELYYTNFSGSAGLIKFHTEYWNSNLPPRGSIQLTVHNFIVPDLPNMCVIARTYTDCCTLYAEAKNCWDIRRLCPPGAITYHFSMFNIVPPVQIDTTVTLPTEWSYSIGWNLPDSVIVDITTDDESPMGTAGRVTLWFKYDSVWEDKNFEVIFTLNSGDASSDCLVNSADIAYLINYLFVGGPAPNPMQAGDVNCDCWVNIADVIYLINYLFVAGPAPVSSETCECGYKGWSASP
jgi:hypothetical protein